MRTTAILVLFAAMTIVACKKSHTLKDEYVTLAYKQTFCSDPWPIGSDDNLTLNNLAAYLDSSGLYMASLMIKQETEPDLCNACTCKTGKTFYVSTLSSDSLQAKYGRIGFR